METFCIKDLSTGEVVCLIDGENIEEVCKKLYFNSEVKVRKIRGSHYRIIPIKKIKTEIELIQTVY